MKAYKIIPTLGLSLIMGAAIAAPTNSDQAKEIQWLPIQQVITQVEGAGYTDIQEIERGRMGYKVKAVNAEGKPTKLMINGETGEIIRQHQAGDKRQKMEHQKHSRKHEQMHKKMHGEKKSATATE